MSTAGRRGAAPPGLRSERRRSERRGKAVPQERPVGEPESTAGRRGAAPPGLRSEERATREGGASKAPRRRAANTERSRPVVVPGRARSRERGSVPSMDARDRPSVPAGRVTVVGIGADGWAGLTGAARDALRAAAVIAGSPRQLALLPDLGARRVPLPSPLLEHLDDLVRDNPGLCLLASGDPTLHGIGATLARRLGADRLRILPAVSSVTLACARLGWPQQEVTVVSLVSQPADAVLAALQPGARVLVLCRDRQTPARAARLLAEAGWGASELIVLEQLGAPGERVTGPQPADHFLPAEIDDLCLLAVAARPCAGQLLWDVGAGSGSVGIEWMRADPLARAIAIEARPDRAARVGRNAAALGVPGLVVVERAAPGALDGHAPPDAVFVGGGAGEPEVLDKAAAMLRSGGRLVVNAVTLETEALLLARHAAAGGELVRIAIARTDAIGGKRGWRPALPVTQWTWVKP